MQVFVIMSNVGIMINAENLVFDNADGYIKKKEENRNKYLVVVFKDQNKAVLSKSTKRWDWFKNLIEKKKKSGKPRWIQERIHKDQTWMRW